MLSRDEKELWNFLAAQLQLHFGHFIDKLPTIDNVVTSVQQYERLFVSYIRNTFVQELL